jgi:hypothetical protein
LQNVRNKKYLRENNKSWKTKIKNIGRNNKMLENKNKKYLRENKNKKYLRENKKS